MDYRQLIQLGDPCTWEPYRAAPFSGWHSMIKFVDAVRKQNDDAMLLLDGLEGSGKSTLAFQIALALDPNWNPKTGLIIDYEDWERVYDLKERQVFILDEGGNLMFSRDSMKGENKVLVRMFQMARIFNHVIIVCCPNLQWVDVYVRNHRALIYIHALKQYHARGITRGKAVVHWPDRWFNRRTAEWENSWKTVVTLRFREVPRNWRMWQAYERFKKEKAKRSHAQMSEEMELQAQTRAAKLERLRDR